MSAALPHRALVAPATRTVELAGPGTPPQRPNRQADFAGVLGARLPALQFSKHALQRIQRREIELGPATLHRLQGGVARASGKGSRESVVFIDGTAFVVSVCNRTVITALGSHQMREHVFTNIDSAVIA